MKPDNPPPAAMPFAIRTWGAAALFITVGLIALTSCSRGDDAPAETPPSPTPVDAGTMVQAQNPGISDQRVLFGQSAAFSGPAQELGRNMRLGIEAAFHEVNQRGGVHGRQLEVLSLDDSYEPDAAIANTKQLIEEEQVFALIGAVGTPTSRSAAPVAAEAGIPYIAPFTGAGLLRGTEWNNIINLRASYNQETEEMVARLTEDLGIDRIAVMYQDDSFGRAGYRGARLALDRRGMEPVAIGLYPRNTTAVKAALLDLREGNPDAVILVGAYKPIATLIAWARDIGMDPIFMTVSFVGSNALAGELGPDGAGVFVTQVVPFPTDGSPPVVVTRNTLAVPSLTLQPLQTSDNPPIVDAYLNALSDFAPAAVPGFVSLEGYLAGRLAVTGLEACGQEVDRTCFLNSLLGIDQAVSIDLDGFSLNYASGDNQGSDAIFLTVIGQDGNFHPVDTLRDISQ